MFAREAHAEMRDLVQSSRAGNIQPLRHNIAAYTYDIFAEGLADCETPPKVDQPGPVEEQKQSGNLRKPALSDEIKSFKFDQVYKRLKSEVVESKSKVVGEGMNEQNPVFNFSPRNAQNLSDKAEEEAASFRGSDQGEEAKEDEPRHAVAFADFVQQQAQAQHQVQRGPAFAD